MELTSPNFLNKINSPADLRKLSTDDLIQVCAELRDFIIDAVSNNPAHFGASLGVVELTVALHYVFDTPYDKIVWDVGHQAYGHKILTGRRDIFHTNRKYGGISGFPNIFESEYDAFGVGHSSTSISAALGMATAFKMQGETERQAVAIIGDGAMTAGLAFEGLNNLATSQANMLVILNDNNMAIDPNVGGMSEYLVDIATSKTYNSIRKEVIKTLGKTKIVGERSREFIVKLNNSIKTLITRQTNIFEGLNIRYFGPVDGHDVQRLTQVLKDLKDIKGPKVLHVITKKGKGFKVAEEQQTIWHAPSGKFNKETGLFVENGDDVVKPPRFQDVFGHTIVELAKENEKIVGITPAMPTGCSMTYLMKEMPDRAFDVGIAEQHAVTFAAGLSISGLLPFCNIYSTFAQRAYDQIIHDVAIQNLNVVFCIDRGGLVGPDGPTHHGVYDLSFFRSVPQLTVSSPMDEVELRNLMYSAQLPDQGPYVIRYPRGNGSIIDWRQPMQKIEKGTARLISKGEKIAVLSIGPIGVSVNEVVKEFLRDKIKISHYDMRFVKPIDENVLHTIGKEYKSVITIEDGTIIGGLGSAVIEFFADNGYKTAVDRIGIPDKYIDQGTIDDLYADIGMDKESIKMKILEKIATL